jgi:hypothetical protein
MHDHAAEWNLEEYCTEEAAEPNCRTAIDHLDRMGFASVEELERSVQRNRQSSKNE